MSRSGQKGFTLIEMLIVIAIVPIILIAISDSVISFYRANSTSIEEAYQIQSSSRGVNTLVLDLREATYAENGAYPVESIATSSVSFFADTAHDGVVERVRYSLSGTTLSRAVTPPGSPVTYSAGTATTSISDSVRNIGDGTAIFRYFDENGNEILDMASVKDVRSVEITLVVDVTPNHAPGEFTLRSSATLRNLRAQ
jgi:prepilin-type N-terminal cleavage/methylation domain-containing protein